MIRRLIVLCIAALACACASPEGYDQLSRKAKPPPAVTPTEQFAITVRQAPDEVLLAPHPEGVSDAQKQALAQLVDRWRNSSSDVLTVRAPASGQEAMYRSTAGIQGALEALGVAPEQIRLTSYDAGPAPGAPIAVGFLGYRARGPECGREWKDYTQTADNKVSNNFGCAVTANIAAMIANPGDLLTPRPMGSSDAQRREAVIDKYHKGDVTSTAADPQAKGSVSGAIQ